MSVRVIGTELRTNPLLREQAAICGEWRGSDSGETIEVDNPADGTVFGSVPNCGAEETLQAIQHCDRSFREWRKVPAGNRGELLRSWHRLMLDHESDLAEIICAEAGKPIKEAIGEVRYAASFIAWFAGEAERLNGDIIPSQNASERWIIIPEPVGVCFAITPWNFPAAMITRKAAAALAAGCSILVKPAMETPLTALAIAALAEEAGIPKGLISVITGDAIPIAETAMASTIVRKLTFTGSTPVGKLLMRQAADTVKRLSLELGGNAPFIVFEDADLDAATHGLLTSKFRNAGQTCVCTNRVYVHASIFDAFSERMANAMSKLKMGNGFASDTDIGPLINLKAVSKMREIEADASELGADIIQFADSVPNQGYFFKPTLIRGATSEMTAVKEEIFGPVLPICSFESDDEVVAAANAYNVGLASYIYTQSARRMWEIPEALEVGMVGVNRGLISNAVAPFGGVKESGMGREGSKYGLDEYLERKYVAIGL